MLCYAMQCGAKNSVTTDRSCKFGNEARVVRVSMAFSFAVGMMDTSVDDEAVLDNDPPIQ